VGAVDSRAVAARIAEAADETAAEMVADGTAPPLVRGVLAAERLRPTHPPPEAPVQSEQVDQPS